MADDRLSSLEADVTALRAAYHALLGRTTTLETRVEERAGEADRLRDVELAVAGLRASLMVAVPVLTIGIPLLVRALLAVPVVAVGLVLLGGGLALHPPEV